MDLFRYLKVLLCCVISIQASLELSAQVKDPIFGLQYPINLKVNQQDRGHKYYELNTHLEHVLQVVTDRKLPALTGGGLVMQYKADVARLSDFYAFGMLMPERNMQTAHYRYGFVGMEQIDEVKGFGDSYDFGARMYDSRLGRWLSLDPLAKKYPAISPYVYVANSPLQFLDPDGKKIINPYDKYEKYADLEQTLKDNLANAETKDQKKLAKKELKKNRGNIAGYNKFKKVDDLLTEFKETNEEEYNRVNNLTLKGEEIDVVVNIRDSKGDIGQYGDTQYSYDPKSVMVVKQYGSDESHVEPTKITNNTIEVNLYYNGRTLSTLANEFGDAIFGVENPRASYEDALNSKNTYYQKSSTNFSFDYEDYIIKGKDKPDPKDY